MGSQLAKNLVSETVSIHPEMPWLDVHGRELPIDVLRLESQSWNLATWEAYLGTIEQPIRETLLSAANYSLALEIQTQTIFESLHWANSSARLPNPMISLNDFSQKQRRIIELIFWKDKSERDTAKILGLSRSSVKTTKKRVLVALKKSFQQNRERAAHQMYNPLVKLHRN